jgi:hypothetical protein
LSWPAESSAVRLASLGIVQSRKAATGQNEAMPRDSIGIDPESHDVASGIDTERGSSGGSRELGQRGKSSAVQQEDVIG